MLILQETPMPHVTIRPVKGQEMMDTLFRLDNYAFRPTPPYPNREEWEGRIKTRVGTQYYALYENEESVAIAACPILTQNVRGKIFKMGGFADISTHPKARRKGYIRQLMRYAYEQLKSQGYEFSCLYPFRESFYERLGYVTFPQSRQAIFDAANLAPLFERDVSGEVELSLIGEAYDIYYKYVCQMQRGVHGMSIFEDPQKESAQENRSWLLQARVDGELVGIMVYNIKGEEMMNYTMQATRFYYNSSQGKYLLLEWIARHVDQAGNARIWLPAYEQPNTWLADIRPKLEPVFFAPMGRVLDLPGIAGMETGLGHFQAEISDPDCPWNNGTWEFNGVEGHLKVSPAKKADCHLTIQGLSALVYGVSDPEDFAVRGWGDPTLKEINSMRKMFPAKLPYLHEYY
jgi:GNAT superfamily N-acetyltransferase